MIAGRSGRPGRRRGDARAARAHAAAPPPGGSVARSQRTGIRRGAVRGYPCRDQSALTRDDREALVFGNGHRVPSGKLPCANQGGIDDTVTIPGLTDKQAARLCELLQRQLSTYNDLHLTLKHIHWNVVGPNFIGVHEMIDPLVESVRAFADDVAERIAALGSSPEGTPGAIVRDRAWDDYAIGRDTVQAHLAALDLVYNARRRRPQSHRRDR